MKEMEAMWWITKGFGLPPVLCPPHHNESEMYARLHELIVSAGVQMYFLLYALFICASAFLLIYLW